MKGFKSHRRRGSLIMRGGTTTPLTLMLGVIVAFLYHLGEDGVAEDPGIMSTVQQLVNMWVKQTW